MLYKQLFILAALLTCVLACAAQQQVIDSLHSAYTKQKSDSNRLRTMWYIVDAYLDYRPDSALLYGEQNLALAKKEKSAKFESLTYKQIGDAYNNLGDYPNALDFFIKRLEMDERENDIYKKILTLNSIGIVYQLENDYNRALQYMHQVEALSVKNHFDDLANSSYINLCDLYGKKRAFAPAFMYGKKALAASQQLKDTVSIGMSYNNIANVFYKSNQPDSALVYYRTAIPFLQLSNAYHTLCESYIGIAQIMAGTVPIDSAIAAARLAATLAQKLKFNNFSLQSCNLLSRYFAIVLRFDSAYYYQLKAVQIKDSVFSDENTKRLQLLTMKEEIRQQEMAEAAIKAAEDRSHVLQLLTIGLLIPVFFFINVLLSKRKIKPRVIELTGILSLLMLFEYITLLIHPAIARFTNNTPIYEIIILIAVAAVLTPAHHRIEEWLIHRLTVHHKGEIRIHTKKIQQKKPE